MVAAVVGIAFTFSAREGMLVDLQGNQIGIHRICGTRDVFVDEFDASGDRILVSRDVLGSIFVP